MNLPKKEDLRVVEIGGKSYFATVEGSTLKLASNCSTLQRYVRNVNVDEVSTLEINMSEAVIRELNVSEKIEYVAILSLMEEAKKYAIAKLENREFKNAFDRFFGG